MLYLLHQFSIGVTAILASNGGDAANAADAANAFENDTRRLGAHRTPGKQLRHTTMKRADSC